MSEEERAAKYSDLFGLSHAHSSDCAHCPICATIAVVRKTKPEILDHLAAAARELIIVAGILIEEAGEVIGPEKTRTDDDQGLAEVRHIDIG